MNELTAYFNGNWVPDSQCVIHATDRGFRLGDVVYDLERTFGGKVFRLRQHLERFMRSLKGETLSRLIFFGEKPLRRAVTAFLAHYHAERNHQGLSNQVIEPGDEVGAVVGKIECRERLGGLLKYYYRRAA